MFQKRHITPNQRRGFFSKIHRVIFDLMSINLINSLRSIFEEYGRFLDWLWIHGSIARLRGPEELERFVHVDVSAHTSCE